MITVVYSSRKENPEYQKHIKETIGYVGLKNFEIIEYVNNGQYSLTEIYNKGIEESKNEIIVFCHDDLIFETNNWGKKLIKNFEENLDYSIIGIAGSRELPKSAKWWENPNHMYGQVYHKHEGKRWLSKYSPKKPKFLDNVVIVDGLFFAIKKSKIKRKFNEEIKGFHFYDVDFSFNNFINGVKIGVTSDIDVTHLSIGMTNEEWEQNRIQFSEKNKDLLPVKAEKIFNKHNKMKILICGLYFKNYTGSELYIYELSKELSKLNCEIHIVSDIGKKMTDRIKEYGVKCFSLNEPPGYKMGDGQWTVTTPNGNSKSEPNKLYKISEEKYDCLILNHKPIGEFILKLYPNTTAINIVHSEVIPNLEEPIIDKNIKKYISIRPEIKKYMIDGWGLKDNDIEVIYNPIDVERFKKYNNPTKNFTLFVGTIDYLRKNSILDLIEYTKKNNKELWLVGEIIDNFINNINEPHVKYFPPTWEIEKYIKECDETAGILLGRTTIEGWLCSKPGWIYSIDKEGNILSKKIHEVPKDVEKFSSKNVSEKIKNEILKILNN